MVKAKYIIRGILILNLIFMGVIFYKGYEEYHTKKYDYKKSIELIKQNIQQETENSGFYPLVRLYKDSPEEKIQQNLKKPILIFYFSISACQPCLEEIVEEIKSIFPDYTKRNDIVFFSNDLEQRLRNNFLGKNIASPANKDNNLPFERHNSPLLFIVDTNNIIHHVFVPTKDNPKLLKKYLNFIKKIL